MKQLISVLVLMGLAASAAAQTACYPGGPPQFYCAPKQAPLPGQPGYTNPYQPPQQYAPPSNNSGIAPIQPCRLMFVNGVAYSVCGR